MIRAWSDGQAPLAGIRIVSLAENYPGPFATMLLADLGADVVMVERPSGEPTRRFPAFFAALNRHKSSVTIDLKSANGKARFETLLADADVLFEGFRPGVLDRLGLAPDRLRARFPHLVIVSISAFGQEGPDSGHGAHDLSIQGRAGVLDLTLDDPTAGTPTADLVAALYATIGTLSALLARHRGQGGAHVDVSMLDCLVSWRTAVLGPALNQENPMEYPPSEPAYGVFRDRGGRPLTISIAGEDHQWASLCAELGLDEVAALTAAERAHRCSSLREVLASAIAGRDAAELVAALAGRGVSSGLVHSDVEVTRDPHLVARGMFVDVTGTAGQRAVRQPLVFDGRTTGARTPAPTAIDPARPRPLAAGEAA